MRPDEFIAMVGRCLGDSSLATVALRFLSTQGCVFWPQLRSSKATQRYSRRLSVLIVTMNDIPGYEVEEVLGEVFGLTVRSRDVFSQIGSTLKSLVGGELRGMTTMLQESREQGVARMVAEAEAKGANAIIAMRFDTSELGEQLDGDLRLRDCRPDSRIELTAAMMSAAARPGPSDISTASSRAEGGINRYPRDWGCYVYSTHQGTYREAASLRPMWSG